MGIIEGRFIRNVRKNKGITQVELAKMVEMSHAPIYALENGGESMSLKNLRLIADKLGLEVIIREKNETGGN